MTVKTAGVPLGKDDSEKSATSEGNAAVAKLQAHFSALDEGSLLRVARAVELARASVKRDPTDEQILETLRPRLRELRPARIQTFQRAVCCGVEIYLFDGEPPEEKRRAALPRQVLAPWWRVLTNSPHRTHLLAIETEYSRAVQEQRWGDLPVIVDHGILAAADATLTILGEAERSYGRRGELAAMLGGDRALADMREIGILLRLHPQLSPALDRIRRAAGLSGCGTRINDFTPAAVIAARTAYLNLHDLGNELVEYFFFGLIALLAQPFQALRLVRVLSQEMSGAAADSPARLIPARLFSDLTRTLAEIGRQAGSNGTMGRRVWLLTSARLLSDAGLMIRGLADEAREAEDSEWHKLLADARGRVLGAVDGFANAALLDCQAVLPVRQSQERPGAEVRVEPDMSHAPTEEEQGVAIAAALLLTTVRKLMEQEGLDRSLRAREADLEQRLDIAIKFRVEYLRARPRHAVALAQLGAVHKVLKALPSLNIIRDLEYRVERTLERYKG